MRSDDAKEVLRRGVASLSMPLSQEDLQHGWTITLQRVMLDWFLDMMRRLDTKTDLRGDYCKIARELDMSAVSDGRLYDVCVDTQRRLIQLLGDGE